MRTTLILATAMTSIFSFSAAPAQASHDTPLARAACAYRDSVRHFGRELNSQPRLSHRERRLGHELVDAANRLYVVARHPHQHHRLGAAWYDVDVMHRQVEVVLFNHPGCPLYVALRPCWNEVLCASNDLVRHLRLSGCLGHGHGHGHGHRRGDHHGHAPRHPRIGSPWVGYPGFPRYPSAGVIARPSLPRATQPSYRYRDALVPSYRYGNYAHAVVPPASKVLRSPSERQISESEAKIQRARTRVEVDLGTIGAMLSRAIR